MKNTALNHGLIVAAALWNASAFSKTISYTNDESPISSDHEPPVILAISESIAKLHETSEGAPSVTNKSQSKLTADGSSIGKSKATRTRRGDSPSKQTMDDIAAMRSSMQNNMKSMRADFSKTSESFRREYQATLAKWEEERKVYFRNIPIFKSNLTPIPIPSGETKPKVIFDDKPKNRNDQNYHLVNQALDVPIKDQGGRGTCASFAAIRVIEIMLRQNQIDQALSEQYFYWASRSDCQSVPCGIGGSWVNTGFEHSRASARPDIPTADACPYSPQKRPNNDTQIPLASGCMERGTAKVEEYMAVASLASVEAAIIANKPVIVAASLSDNFYTNLGIVTLENANSGEPKDSHAKGHAMVIVGFMKLPEVMHAIEGDVCFITANSWGTGWGRGGYACLTKAWLEKHRIPRLDFVALRNIEV